MTKKKILIIVGIVLAVIVVGVLVGQLVKGAQFKRQQSNFIGGPTVGGPKQGQEQKNEQGNVKQSKQSQNNQNSSQNLSFLPACTTGKELFSTFPLKRSDYDSITALGNLNPTGGHTFPTDHIYIQVTGLTKYNYLGNPANKKALLAPADIYITKISKSEEIGGIADYAIEFSPCRDVLGKFGHVGSLSTTINNEIAKIETKCGEYSTGGENYKNCEYDNLKLQVKDGEEIGGAGDGRSGFLDIWLSDYREAPVKRANPSRWSADRNYVSCFLDYLPTAQITGYYDLIRRPNNTKRTKEPRCGTVEVDIVGTAQGVWFYNLTGQVMQEDEHLALAYDNIETDKQVFSVGTTAKNAGIGSGAYSFVPKTDGSVNRDFSQVTANGQVYCYETVNINQQSAKKAILLSLPSAEKLRLKSAPSSSCGTGPWTMTDGFVEYER